MRYLVLLLVWAGLLPALWLASAVSQFWLLLAVLLLLVGLSGLIDMFQTSAPILRNYPVIGRLRFFLQEIRPQIRQYFIEADDDEVPYSRDQRALVAERSRKQDSARPFGSLAGVYQNDHVWINHALQPLHIKSSDFRVPVGQGPQPYEISILNISGTSYGALSGPALESFNRGAKLGGFAHNSGEGGIAPAHTRHGGDLVWQIGTGYFGCRTQEGRFDAAKFAEQAALDQIKMIEIKLSQGAKPGHGGMLLGAKVTADIARIRGVPQGQDCISPAAHTAFHTPEGLLDFVAELRQLSGGKPVGFKLCIGHPWEFLAIAKAMVETGQLPDFITVDGAEGGTGAAPAEFMDNLGCPLKDAVVYVDNVLRAANLRDQLRVAASGKLVSGFDIARICALGADWVNMARPFMFAAGCIQARSCHNGKCPTGIATLDPARSRAINVAEKSQAIANFHKHTRQALAELVGAAGISHPAKLNRRHLVQRVSQADIKLAEQIYPQVDTGAVLAGQKTGDPRIDSYWHRVSKNSFQPRF